MAVPSTGSAANAATFVSAFGETIGLADGTTIKGVFRFHDDPFFDPTSLEGRQREFFTLHVPTDQLGTLEDAQRVTLRGDSYFVRSLSNDSDGWSQLVLTI